MNAHIRPTTLSLPPVGQVRLDFFQQGGARCLLRTSRLSYEHLGCLCVVLVIDGRPKTQVVLEYMRLNMDAINFQNFNSLVHGPPLIVYVSQHRTATI